MTTRTPAGPQAPHALVHDQGAQPRPGWLRGRAHLAGIQPAGGRAREQEHVDELDEDAGRHAGGVRRVDQPLVDDHEDEVAEHAEQEEQLGHSHQVDVELLPEMPVERPVSPGGAAPRHQVAPQDGASRHGSRRHAGRGSGAERRKDREATCGRQSHRGRRCTLPLRPQLETEGRLPAGGSVAGASPHPQRPAPGCGFHPRWGQVREATNRCFSLSLINKDILE